MYNRTLINEKIEELFGSGASQFNMTIDKGIKTHVILLHMVFLQNSTTVPTLANALNQIADEITISIGNSVIMKFDPVEYHEYLIRKFGILGLGFSHEGTGASNDVMHFTLPIILCPLDKDALKFGALPLLQKGYGFDGSKKVSVLIDYPADGNEIDVRTLSAFSVSLPNDTPKSVVEWRSITTKVLSVGEGQKLGLSQKTFKKLYEVIFKQTSYLEEGDNTDVRSIEVLGLMEGNELVHIFDIRLEDFCNPIYVSESEVTGDPQVDDQYQIAEFFHGDDAETSYQLKESSRLSVEVGVAEAITYVQRLITPLNNI